MQKKLSLIIGLILTISINYQDLSAESLALIPLKKPILTAVEIEKKLSKNILKPIKKPKKTIDIKLEEKKIVELKKEKKISYKIPKKKTYYKYCK